MKNVRTIFVGDPERAVGGDRKSFAVDAFGIQTQRSQSGAEGDLTGGMTKKLRDSGYLTRDSRMKERKKYGRKGARRSFQFSKR